MHIKNFKDLLEAAQKQPEKRLVVVNGVDENTIEALNVAVEMGFVTPVLTGSKKRILEILQGLNIEAGKYRIVDAESPKEAAEKAIDLVNKGEADLIMKGLVTTDKFMRVLLKKEYGLVPASGTLSHISVMDNPNYHKLLIFSDAGVIPYPDLKQKILMTENLIQAAKLLGIEYPKVAVIAPTEQIIISIQSCMDGATIAKMSEHRQIEGGMVDGPMALDVALDRSSAEIKGFTSPVAAFSEYRRGKRVLQNQFETLQCRNVGNNCRGKSSGCGIIARRQRKNKTKFNCTGIIVKLNKCIEFWP